MCLLLILILSNQSQAGAALTGDYTIGGSSPDYVTINLAVADLISNGISGPVNFLMRGGSYNEQVTITAFQRFGLATDRVTFTKSGPSESINWLYSSVSAGSEWILKLDDVSYITISDLSFNSVISGFGDIVYFEGGSDNITFERNLFDGQFDTGTLIFQNALGNHANNHFISNHFSQGEVAIDFDYIFGGFDSSGLLINDNTFFNQSIKSVETGSSNVIISDNVVSTAATSNTEYIGFDIEDAYPHIKNNTFDMLGGKAAIWAVGNGVAVEGRIINNMIALRNSSASTAGMHVDIENVSIYHNTVRSASATAPALLIAGGIEVRIQNNILINAGAGIALTILNQSWVDVSDYNDIYSTGNPLVRVSGTSYNSLASYKLGTGLDTNSIEQSVSFVNTTGVNDLHLAAPNNNDIDFLAPLIAGVTTDFDGDARGILSVYKGADEGAAFLPLDNADTVSGFYTVGGGNPDYSTPSAAIIDLKQRGMKGPVTFRIRAGFYTTQQTLAGINRSGNSDDLLFFRADDFNNPPTLRNNTNTALKNWIIKIQDMGDISFSHINFSTSASGIYGNLLVVEGDSDNLSISDGIFTGVTGQTVDTAALVQATELGVDNYEFINNQFNNGSIALNLIPSSVFASPRSNRLIIESNTFSQQAAHALLSNHDDIDFNRNDVSNTLNDFVAINIQFNRDTQIGKNKFLLTGTNSTAINLKGADGATVANPNIFSNNFIKSTTGIDLNSGSHTIEMYYNTIVASILPITIQASINESHDIKLFNNILFNNGSGAAIFVAAHDTIDESNFNNFINGSGTLIDWEGSQYASLSAFQNATNFDSRSTTTPVFFTSLVNADFHLVLSSIGNSALTGTPLALVLDDYDSDTRTLASPYMGADQVAGNPIINTYSIGGNISGLASGNTVSLFNSNGDELLNQTNGGFIFSIQPNDGDAYNVNVSSQPTSPDQTCSVANGSGNLSGDDITNIDINCMTNFYSIGGTVTGLTAGNSVSLQNNIADNTVISNNGTYTFLTLIQNGSTYSVTVLSPPGNPKQLCSISNATSTVSNANVTNVDVNCVTETYSVGGSVSGLAQGNSVELQNNNGNNLVVSSNGGFTFTEELDSNSSYAVSVLNNPSTPEQNCLVTNATGDINSTNITNVQISCSTETFTIGGTVTGLLSENSVVLRDNGGDDLNLSTNGDFTFATALDDGMDYNVTVFTQPTSPNQNCIVTNATGEVNSTNITNVHISCTTETFTIGGTVTGLLSENSVVLRDNGGDDLNLSTNGDFTFATALDDGMDYNVTVFTQPTSPNQNCIVTNATGEVNSTNITNVHISCTTETFTIGGTVTGLLSENSVVLRNNGGNDLEVSANGSFTFTTALDDGMDYNVTVFTQPTSPNQNCIVTNATGEVNSTNITNVHISCTTETFTIGGTVTGLLSENSVVLRNNGGNNLEVSANGSFTFTTALDDGMNYNVTVFTHPTAPNQNCLISNGSNTLNGVDITNVNVTCDNLDSIFLDGFETVTKTIKPSQIKNKKHKTNKITISGPQAPQVIPSLSFIGLLLMVFGLLMSVKIRAYKHYENK